MAASISASSLATEQRLASPPSVRACSPFPRILNDREVVVANFDKAAGVQLHAVVEATLKPAGKLVEVLYSDLREGSEPRPVELLAGASVGQADGSISLGAVHAVRIELRGGEVQILA